MGCSRLESALTCANSLGGKFLGSLIRSSQSPLGSFKGRTHQQVCHVGSFAKTLYRTLQEGFFCRKSRDHDLRPVRRRIQHLEPGWALSLLELAAPRLQSSWRELRQNDGFPLRANNLLLQKSALSWLDFVPDVASRRRNSIPYNTSAEVLHRNRRFSVKLVRRLGHGPPGSLCQGHPCLPAPGSGVPTSDPDRFRTPGLCSHEAYFRAEFPFFFRKRPVECSLLAIPHCAQSPRRPHGLQEGRLLALTRSPHNTCQRNCSELHSSPPDSREVRLAVDQALSFRHSTS